MVTGGSEGIGQAYACELARRGLNVVVISRSEGKLAKAKALIGMWFELWLGMLKIPLFLKEKWLAVVKTKCQKDQNLPFKKTKQFCLS